MDNGHPKDLDAILAKVKDSKYTTVVCISCLQMLHFLPSLIGKGNIFEGSDNQILGWLVINLSPL